MKKSFIFLTLFFSLWTVCLWQAAPASVQAAKGGGGVRMSAPKSMPAPAAPKASAPAASPKVNTKEASKPAAVSQQSQMKMIPAQTTAQANQRSSSTRWGNALRGIGLFAGGMFLGNLLSHSLGWGNMGFGADFLGLLINLILLLIVIRLVISIWRALRRKR